MADLFMADLFYTQPLIYNQTGIIISSLAVDGKLCQTNQTSKNQTSDILLHCIIQVIIIY